jgi:hypothetical protein
MLRGDALATAWDLFLRTERCALPLRSRLLAAAGPSLPPGPANVLEARATAEIQRALSARAQVLQIRQLATAHGIVPIVLKGGVLALGGNAPLDVADADVLVESEAEAQLLCNLLDERGYRAAASRPTAWHLVPRHVPEAVLVEIHFTIADVGDVREMRARALPLPGFPGLRRFAPADHLWHLLVHCVIQHPHRRGCLRDVVLVHGAARECSPAELTAIAGRVARHPDSSALASMFALAQGLGTGSAGRTDDCFIAGAAANYLLRTRFRWAERVPVLGPCLSTTVFALLGSGADRRAEWVDAVGRPFGTFAWTPLAAMQRRWPALGGAPRRLLRTGRLVLARFVAWPIAASARRIAARSLRGAARR